MQLKNEFVVDADVDDAWNLLTDVERIASSMPGAVLDVVTDDGYTGTFTVKVGSVEARFQGSMRFTLKDDARRHAVITLSGQDRNGPHIADATVHAWLEEVTPAQTRALIDVDLQITGRIAQFGRGAIADVSNRLFSRFAADVARFVVTRPAPAVPAPAPAMPTAPTVTATPIVTDRYRQALLGALIGFLLSWLVFGRQAGGRRYIVLYPHPNPVEDQRITGEWGRESR